MNIRRKHINIEQRNIIEDGIHEELTASCIARRIGVSPSTVTREVKFNRVIKPVTRDVVTPSRKCKHKETCNIKTGSCRKCVSPNTACPDCKMRDCTLGCEKFESKLCKHVEQWPYVCPQHCKKRRNCWYPKCSYIAREADKLYYQRLVQSREGIDITEDELAKINNIVTPLIKNGQSPEAIWTTHSNELAISFRTYYNYVHQGKVDVHTMELRRAVKYKKRNHARNSRAKTRIDRTGREYDDYIKLDIQVLQRTVQIDSLIGRRGDKQRVVSLHITRINFQFYFLAKDGTSKALVDILNKIERFLGSPEKFRVIFGLLLGDRGEEFDDIEAIERSCLNPDKLRCKMYFCDSNRSYQKGKCEKNHVEFRKILPKKESNFDALEVRDLAIVTSHVNSYPRPILGGESPIKLAKKMLPVELLEGFGIEEIPPDEIILRQSLLEHSKL